MEMGKTDFTETSPLKDKSGWKADKIAQLLCEYDH